MRPETGKVATYTDNFSRIVQFLDMHYNLNKFVYEFWE